MVELTLASTRTCSLWQANLFKLRHKPLEMLLQGEQNRLWGNLVMRSSPYTAPGSRGFPCGRPRFLPQAPLRVRQFDVLSTRRWPTSLSSLGDTHFRVVERYADGKLGAHGPLRRSSRDHAS